MARITMNFSKDRVGGLSQRLLSLRSSYTNQKHIWDIGCDHGLLGGSFLVDERVETVNLVDASEKVVEVLKVTYKDSYISKPVLNLLWKEGQELNINSNSNCIFIAGMGGKEIYQIISHLLPSLDESSLIVVSPHRWIRELREKLSELPLSLKNEKVVFEHNRFYEIMTLIPGKGERKVPRFGDEMWRSEIGKKYKTHQLDALKGHKDEASLHYLEYLRRV